MGFNKLYQEITDILIKSVGRPDCSDNMWINALRKLFSIKNRLCNSKLESKQKTLKKFMYSKIAELLNLMSKYVEFEKVVNELIQIEKDAEFSFTNEWLKSIFFSKNDQEFLYKSARVLLSNENTQLIEVIVRNHENGFKGDVYEGCSICRDRLGSKYLQSP